MIKGEFFKWVRVKFHRQVSEVQKKWKLMFEISIWLKKWKINFSRKSSSRHRSYTSFWLQFKMCKRKQLWVSKNKVRKPSIWRSKQIKKKTFQILIWVINRTKLFFLITCCAWGGIFFLFTTEKCIKEFYSS